MPKDVEILMMVNNIKHCGKNHVLQQYEFRKAPIPSSKEDRVEFSRKLSKYNITLSQYENTLT